MSLIRFDGIVYVHYVSHSVPPALAARFFNRRLRTVLHYHGSDAFPEVGEGATRRALKWLICKMGNASAAAVLAPSASFLGNLQKRFDLANTYVAVSPSGGVDTNVFNPSNLEAPLISIVFAGRMIEGKGGLQAARVASKVLDAIPAANALFIGEGPERRAIESELRRHEISGRVRFEDLLPPRDLAKRFRDCRVLLFPSSRKGESLGLTWIEAGLCGAIPLVLKNGVTEKLIPEQLRGELVAASEEVMVGQAIELLLNPERRKKIASLLMTELEFSYSRENVSKRLDELLSHIYMPASGGQR